MSLSLQEHYDKIYRYCYFKVQNIQLAEDLTQETFLKYFSQTSYINRGKQLAYLYTIARNLCVDAFRKREELPLDEEIVSNDGVCKFDENYVLRQGISTLPKDLQEIILMRFANELGIGEIANIMEVSRFAVYRKLNTALAKLRGILREEDFS